MKNVIVFTILILSSFHLQADKMPFQLPAELMTQYGVISPLCFKRFTELSEKKQTLNLKNDSCIRYHQPYNDYALKNGFLGYNLNTDEPGMKLPYIFYRYIGKLTKNKQPEYVFLISWSGGGTGSFTELQTMTLDKDILKSKQTIATGDRCNGSVKDATVSNNQLQYQVAMTPQTLFEVNNPNINQQAEFPDCAVCCIGTIYYQGNKVTGVKFNGQLQNATPKEKKLYCFNHFAKKFGATKKAFLTIKQLKHLQHDISTSCLKQ